LLQARTDDRIRGLENALAKVADHLSIPEIMEYEADDNDEGAMVEVPSTQVSPHREKHTPLNFEIVYDPDAGPAAIPGSVVSPVSLPGIENRKAEQDLITRGVVTVEQAQNYLDIYQNRLDHFLYRILGDRRTLAQVRSASSLLLAAICAVGALHLASSDFEKCYQEFVSVAAAQTFNRRNNVDDVRGLCIAAFWLSGISWVRLNALPCPPVLLTVH
jgi:hypothetical protein